MERKMESDRWFDAAKMCRLMAKKLERDKDYGAAQMAKIISEYLSSEGLDVEEQEGR